MNMEKQNIRKNPLIISRQTNTFKSFLNFLGRALLLTITALPTLAIVFMLFFILKEALPFFKEIFLVKEFFTSTHWAPSKDVEPHFGALAIFYGTAMVTLGSCIIAVPLGIVIAISLNEIVSPKLAQIFKPVVEMLAAIPSVAYGFFAIVIFAPLLQDCGGLLIGVFVLFIGIPISILLSIPISEFVSQKLHLKNLKTIRICVKFFINLILIFIPIILAKSAFDLKINSGTNALNASIILAIMALPTIVSLSHDALAGVGRDMREGSLSLGGTRFETIFKVILPCAKSGIAVAVILGLMRVIGETMVVWMASGNSLKIPEPFYNFLEPVRTLTATIAGEMGEADQSTGSARYHVLFAMSFCLLVSGLIMNFASQWISKRKY